MKRIASIVALLATVGGTAAAAAFLPEPVPSPPKAAKEKMSAAVARSDPVVAVTGRDPVPLMILPGTRKPKPSRTEPPADNLAQSQPVATQRAQARSPVDVRVLSDQCGGRTPRSIAITGDGAVHTQC
jgi:hypothetical protein